MGGREGRIGEGKEGWKRGREGGKWRHRSGGRMGRVGREVRM